ncbi:HAMP domain-containing histidine kinase [Sphingobacterium shayense]|uniref:sensor histidine kinase n=1 Tax=Sphingobacterium shayense TaxID=626343 RepID=UPI0015528DC3|nr:HAMP domain-containing sensor histidine kinase [Sphingobacterium shayense]NQD72224.1 HAMP domain-containing histidine kinase [Sphingobacterium shayense]
MSVSLRNYTLRYLSIAFLVIITLWASLFYAYILDEVYDNVDDGLKNQKIEILRAIYENPTLLETSEFGVNQFRISEANGLTFTEKNQLTSEFFYMPYDDEQEPYRVLRTGFYAADRRPYQLEIRTSTVEEDDLIYDLSVALVVLYIVLVLAMYLVNGYVLRRAWKPFNSILNNINHYRFGQKEQLKPLMSDVREFKILDSEIRQMWKRNEEVFDEQKLFIENASHELQTPLAIAINKLELMMAEDDLDEKRLTGLSSAKSVLLRLVNLNRALLMLSRIDNKQYKSQQDVDLSNIIKGLTEDFEDLLSFKNIKLHRQIQGHFVCHMNADLALVLLSNLLRNALRHNYEGGVIEISSSPNFISIANSATGSGLDINKIFRRFHKGSQDDQSNGLGLAIVKSIVDLYPTLALEYTFSGAMHIFTLKFED